MTNAHYYIYKITDTLNNKFYIGQSIVPDKRWEKHKSYAKNNAVQYIHRAMNKYGIENFIFEVIAGCYTREDADIVEAEFILEYKSREKEFGYNIKPGGMTQGHSDETRKKLSEATHKQIAEKGHPSLGKKRNEEQLVKMRAAQQKKMAERKDEIYTPELRKQISDALKGRKQGPETVAKRVAAIKETKAKKHLTGEIHCHYPDCGATGQIKYQFFDGIRYCIKHGLKLKRQSKLGK